jgi:hypothetical protein
MKKICGYIRCSNEFDEVKHSTNRQKFCCKICKGKQWRLDNAERLKANEKQWELDNAERLKAYRRQYRIDNIDKARRYGRQYSKDNVGVHNEYHNQYQKERKKNDPLFAFICKIRTRISQSLKIKGYKKSSKTARLLGCSYTDFLQYLGPKPSETCHLDHICPNAQAQNEQELIKLQHFSNFQWLEALPNLIKSDSWTPDGETLCLKLLGRPWRYDIIA